MQLQAISVTNAVAASVFGYELPIDHNHLFDNGHVSVESTMADAGQRKIFVVDIHPLFSIHILDSMLVLNYSAKWDYIFRFFYCLMKVQFPQQKPQTILIYLKASIPLCISSRIAFIFLHQQRIRRIIVILNVWTCVCFYYAISYVRYMTSYRIWIFFFIYFIRYFSIYFSFQLIIQK